MSEERNQRKPDIERLVGERTRELKAENDALRLELNHILDSIPAGAAWISATGESEYANKYLQDFFGKTMDELRDWVSANVIHPDELASSIQSTVDSLRTGAPYFHERRQRRFDGVYRWFQVRALPIRDENSRVIRWCVLHTDIDELKRAEDELRSRERDARAMIDSIPVGASTVGPTGELEVVNQHMLDYFGRSFDDVKNWMTTGAEVHPDDFQRVISAVRHSLATGEPRRTEQRLRRSDGVYRWFEVRAHPFRDATGSVIRWYIVYVDIDDRKRAEEALHESRENLRVTVDTIPALAWTARPDGTADFINKYYSDYVGISAGELAEWGWPRAVHPDDFPALAATWQAALDSGEAAEAEARLQRADGQYRWFLFRTNPLRDEHGAILKWYGVNTDIHDRKQAEEELRRSEAFLVQAQTLTLTGSLWLNTATQEIVWSDESYRLLEVPRSVKPSVELIISRCHPDDLPRWQEQAERVFADGANMDLEHRVVMPDGRIKHVHVVLQRIDDGAPEFVGAVTDITERRRVERALKEASNHLNEAQRLSQSGSFTADLQNDVHTWSDEFCRICELEPGTRMTLEKIRGLIHPEDGPLFARALDVAIAGGDPIFSFRIVTRSGVVKLMQGSAHHLGEGQLLVGAIQDVTERRRNEDALDRARTELAHASRALSLSALTASIAHEINQPLSGVVLNANTCLRMLQRANHVEAEEAARLTIRDGKRASEVIARLRTLFSKKEFTATSLDLNAVAREVLALSRRELEQRHISIETVFARDLPKVLGDRVQLQQVILNLVLNASDAMKEVDSGRRLIIETARHETNAVQISVNDNGVGIAPEALAQVFDPFYTTKAEGMGIGLSVSRSIIERHRGRIWASANKDGGACFSFTVPCARPRDADGCETQ